MPPKTALFMGHPYPVIAELTDGFYLVRHPNGPAICGQDWLSVLEENDADSLVAKKVKRLAVRLYIEWAHPQTKEPGQ